MDRLQVAGHRVDDPAVRSRLKGQENEDVIDQPPAGESERNVAQTPGDMDLRPVSGPQLPDGLQGMVTELAVDRDGKHQDVDVDAGQRDLPVQGRLHHA